MNRPQPATRDTLMPNRWSHFLPLLVSAEARSRYRARRRYRRERARMEKLPRYTRTTSDLLGTPLEVVDGASMIWTYHELFNLELYSFLARREDPLILDCGANIGLSILYFKRLYSASRIVAFEADPDLFSVLERNVAAMGVEDVKLISRAVWSSETELPFHSEGADAGRLARDGDTRERTISTVRLRDYLDQPVDLLKIDIEGAEMEVLADCADRLRYVDHLYVEYHSFKTEVQSLPELLAILKQAGFRLHVRSAQSTPKPFVIRQDHLGMDLKLHVFAYRES
jgi:FkbM family methyltransferase